MSINSHWSGVTGTYEELKLKSFLKITEAEQMNVSRRKTNIKPEYKLWNKTYDKKTQLRLHPALSDNMNLFDFEALNCCFDETQQII